MLAWSSGPIQDIVTLSGYAKLFTELEVKVLTDEKATAQGIVAGLAWLKDKMTFQDTAVIFYAGHGHKDRATSQFFLVPQDVNLANLKATLVSGNEVKKRLGL